MNPLEQELKNALRREEPSADFADRVLARLPSMLARKPTWSEALFNLFRMPALRWATAAALCLAVVVGGVAYRRHQETIARGEMARRQVMLALHIASSKLNVALRQVQRTDEPRDARSVPNSD
jgi:hypothetical protein